MAVIKNFSHNSNLSDSEPDWSGIDKKSLPREAFADQGHTYKPASWDHPHHWVKDGGNKDENGILTTGALHLHKTGLDAAFHAAQDASQEVKDHLQSHRNALRIKDSARFENLSAKTGLSTQSLQALQEVAFEPMNFSHNSTVSDSEPSWGSVDKTSLPQAAFADHGEAGKKSTWKYPHHFIKGGGDKNADGIYTSGTMYLHKGGLNAAWSAAQGGRSGQEASSAVKSHLNAHRKALGIEDMAMRYSMKVQNQEAEIWIYEEIGDSWFGGLSASQFAKDIKELGSVNKITLRLNSPGGDVFDGVAIYNILKQHKAHVIVKIDGIAASIASVIAMAGDEIYMAENAMMMIHRVWCVAIGGADEMRKTANLLDKTSAIISGTYAKRAKLDEEKVKALMADETWMNAKEALDYGFIDEITENLELAAHFDMQKFQYRHTPTQMMQERDDLRSKLAHMSLAAKKIRVTSNPMK